ncbi:MAG: conserved membrane protein of unknown function [Promethearchaeota archaeon]|nr:MAG: conserved membrane protein of unknown function [Candidatus Lokiarchaeota archaeon]
MEESFYYALGHDLRRKILKIIGKNEYTSFTELKKKLKVSTGTIYHHLDTLEKLVTQKKNKKYYLTDLGQYAYDSLLENTKSFSNLDVNQREFQSPFLKLLLWLTPNLPLEIEKKKKIIFILLGIGLVFAGMILSSLTGSFTLLFFFIPSIEEFEGYNLFIGTILGIEFIINILLFFLLIEGATRIIYRTKTNLLSFWFFYIICYLPMIVYLLFHYLFLIGNLLDFVLFDFLDTLLLIFFQILSIWFLTYNISRVKDIKIESSLILTLILHISTFSIILFISL